MADGQGGVGEVAPGGAGVIGTQADYARHRGWSPPYVTKLKKQGKLPVRPDGKIDFAEADQALAALADPGRDAPDGPAEADGLGLADDADLGDAGEGLDGEDGDPAGAARPQDGIAQQRARARLLREAYQAKQAQLEYQQRARELVSRKDVEAAMAEAARVIRGGFDAIPGMADEVVSIVTSGGGAQEVRQALRGRVRDLEERLAANLTRLGEGGDDGGEGDDG